jgi:lysophospholipase L1-like esterase
MKNILCFGDSNTWGYIPITKQRYDFRTRWTGILQNRLGDGYRIAEEGLNGRTTNRNEDERAFRSGVDLLPVMMESHSPIDLLIVMLGTNDLKYCFNDSASDIAEHVKQLCQLASNDERFIQSNGQLLLISPTLVTQMSAEDETIFAGAFEKSKSLAQGYKRVAEELGIHYYNACDAVTISNADGVHWTAEQHQDFANKLESIVRGILE